MTKTLRWLSFYCVLLGSGNCLSLEGTPSAVKINSLAPDVQLIQLETGETFQLNAYLGQVVYLDFWASYCQSCREAFAMFNALHQSYADQGFTVLAVNLDDDPAVLAETLERYSLKFSVVRDNKLKSAAKRFGVEALPTGVLIDAGGRVRLYHRGFSRGSKQFLSAHIEKLLAEKELLISQ
ncbi:Thiol-disulfide oxidoreductase ResA [Thalassocella blandensis]|nr:Thiol-disulfide oxidoreductase ResA [Thalassocella blandensis]